jgi:hypothetical protein
VLAHVIDGMAKSSMNVGVQVAEGELIMGDGNILPEGSTVASDEEDGGRDSPSRRADRTLEEQGFEIQKVKGKGRPTRYSLVKGSGPEVPFLLSESEKEF